MAALAGAAVVVIADVLGRSADLAMLLGALRFALRVSHRNRSQLAVARVD